MQSAITPEIFQNIDVNLLAKFKAYHSKNPGIYQKFKEYTLMLSKTGRKRYSAWCIINKIRWDHDISTTGIEFKISNDFIALYARLFVYHNPEFKEFFSMKRMKASNRKKSDGTYYDSQEELL